MAFTDSDRREIERIARKEMKDFLDTTNAQNVVIRVIQKELGTKKIDEKIVDLASKVVVELFKTLWQRKSFWESPIKNVR